MPILKKTWMTDEQFDVWLQYYIDAGGEGVPDSQTTALSKFREDPRYVQWFPGIRREEDDAIRYPDDPEYTYYSNVQGYKNAVQAAGIPSADIFSDGYVELIKGDVSVNEFAARTSSIYTRVLQSGGAIRDWYGDNYGIDMTDAGIVASLLDEDVQRDILERNITMAEIGGSAAARGYDLTDEFVDMLEREGMDRNTARNTFGTAAGLLPALGALARRHADPDDTFSIEEFTEGAFLDDPEQLARLGRLQAQEEAQFKGGSQIEYERSRATGGISGLQQN